MKGQTQCQVLTGVVVFVPVPGLMPQAYNVGDSFEPPVMQDLFRKMPEHFRGVASVVNAEQRSQTPIAPQRER